jgi:5-methylcytosine-specific restriction endonuclease McrA
MPSQLPKNLSPCDPLSHVFPKEWKEAYFRRNIDTVSGGYICPDCKKIFSGIKGFNLLEGDHIHPRAKGGLTVWENLTLRCKACNIRKSDKLL